MGARSPSAAARTAEIAEAWYGAHPELVPVLRRAFCGHHPNQHCTCLSQADRDAISAWVTRTVMRSSVGVLRLVSHRLGDHVVLAWRANRPATGATGRLGYQIIVEEAAEP